MKDQIEARIAELETEREAFVMQANQRLSAYNAVINELKRLIAPQDSGAGNKEGDNNGSEVRVQSIPSTKVA